MSASLASFSARGARGFEPALRNSNSSFTVPASDLNSVDNLDIIRIHLDGFPSFQILPSFPKGPRIQGNSHHVGSFWLRQALKAHSHIVVTSVHHRMRKYKSTPGANLDHPDPTGWSGTRRYLETRAKPALASGL